MAVHQVMIQVMVFYVYLAGFPLVTTFAENDIFTIKNNSQ